MTTTAAAPAPVSTVVDRGRPVRFSDPARNAAYWARIDAILDQAPPLALDQRAIIRAAFHQPEAREAA